ncbi:MAG TPA: Rid family hydrolase [Microbacteriaceae bacterium]|nr:Rid family hydrolase [Microbacteriaceae bacterium]
MAERVHRIPAPVFPGIADSVRVTAGDQLFLSGVVALRPDGTPAQSFQEEAELVFAALQAALERGGATFSDLIRVNVYIVGLTPERVATYREVRDRFIDPENVPASTLIGIAALVSGAFQIEIDAIAAV